ncbi:MAG TPA: hypothetical protein VGH53_26305, partial [Streptosporangiaceae bacterium]
MSAPDNQPGPDGQQIPREVAELAGQLSEAEDESRRRRLARQITSVAGRTGHATKRHFGAGRIVLRHGTRAGSATLRGLQASSQWLTAQALV